MSFFSSRPQEDSSPLHLKSGTDYAVEEDADRWLAQSRQGVTALSDKRDFLTRDQLALRASKEVISSRGVIEESLYPGLFRRAYNPLIGHRSAKRGGDDE